MTSSANLTNSVVKDCLTADCSVRRHIIDERDRTFALMLNRVKELEGALRPFAAYASGSAYISYPMTPDHGAPANTPHSVGEYRRARAALAQQEK
jgi:hypothetical protein